MSESLPPMGQKKKPAVEQQLQQATAKHSLPCELLYPSQHNVDVSVTSYIYDITM
jgi:hypothetical protein